MITRRRIVDFWRVSRYVGGQVRAKASHLPGVSMLLDLLQLQELVPALVFVGRLRVGGRRCMRSKVGRQASLDGNRGTVETSG